MNFQEQQLIYLIKLFFCFDLPHLSNIKVEVDAYSRFFFVLLCDANLRVEKDVKLLDNGSFGRVLVVNAVVNDMVQFMD